MEDLVLPKDYIYRDVEYLNNWDGDTIDFKIRKSFDLGFGSKVKGECEIKIRLMGVEAYDIKDRDEDKRSKALEAKNMIRKVLLEAEKDPKKKVILATYKDRKGKYGRYLAWVYIGDMRDENCLNEMLKEAGLTTGKYEED